jgi:hypothetical protein
LIAAWQILDSKNKARASWLLAAVRLLYVSRVGMHERIIQRYVDAAGEDQFRACSGKKKEEVGGYLLNF